MCVKLEEFNNLNYMIKNKYKLKYTNISITLLYIYIYISTQQQILFFWGKITKGKKLTLCIYVFCMYHVKESSSFFKILHKEINYQLLFWSHITLVIIFLVLNLIDIFRLNYIEYYICIVLRLSIYYYYLLFFLHAQPLVSNKSIIFICIFVLNNKN